MTLQERQKREIKALDIELKEVEREFEECWSQSVYQQGLDLAKAKRQCLRNPELYFKNID